MRLTVKRKVIPTVWCFREPSGSTLTAVFPLEPEPRYTIYNMSSYGKQRRQIEKSGVERDPSSSSMDCMEKKKALKISQHNLNDVGNL